MACNPEFIEFVCAQIEEAGFVRPRKIFGEYVIYVEEKAVILASHDLCYVQMHPAIEEFMQDAEIGTPFPGARDHYILEIENRSLAVKVVHILSQVLPYPKKKRRRNAGTVH